jgi:class 3 adenylate cyclase/TPR repeat protein
MARNLNIRLITLFLLVLAATLSCGEADAQSSAQSTMKKPPPDTVSDGIRLGRDVMYRKGKADAYLMIAEMEENDGKLAMALSYYFSAIYELEIIGDSLLIAETKVKIGTIFKNNQLYDKALEYFTASELVYLRSGLIEEHPELLVSIGEVHVELEDYPEALKYYSRAAEIQKRADQSQQYTLTSYRMVQCFNATGQYQQALEYNFIILKYFQDGVDASNEISALNNIGYTYKNLGNYSEALTYFKKAAELERETTGYKSPVTLVNQAIVYQNMGNNNKAIAMLNEASGIADKIEDEWKGAEYRHLTALVYFNLKDYHNALIYNNASIESAKRSRNTVILRDAYLLSSRIYEALYNYENAMLSFQQHLIIKDSLQRHSLQVQQDLNKVRFNVEELTRETERLWASEELSFLELQRLKLDSANREQELQILYKADSIQRITIQNQQLENQRAKQALLLKEEQVYAAKKAKEVDSLRAREKIQSLELETQRLIQKDQQAQIEILDRENEIAGLELRKVQTRNKWLAAFAVLALIIIYLVIRGLRYARRTNKVLVKQKNEIERQKDEIDYQRERSDKLLLNILPEETAEELKEKGSATPKQYEMVSVLFTDFKGFTNIAEKLTPQELVAELNNCFLEFDKIIDNHKLEKIKTIGDAYMCAGGIPVANTTNPTDIVEAGLEIKSFMDKLKAEREAKGMDFWELRIGIHTGPVVAGVVGKNKFAYDIWGDAVNTASRMESSGIPGKVNISGETYQLIKDKFSCTYRGKIKAKNKGEIDMYIVEGLNHERK